MRELGYKSFKEGDIVVNPQMHDKRFKIEYRIDSEFIGFVPIEIDENNKPISNRLSIYTPWDKLELEDKTC